MSAWSRMQVLRWVLACSGVLLWIGAAKPLLAQHWVGSWAASQQIPEPANSMPPEEFHDGTLREVVHLSTGGRRIRLHLSNAFGTSALVLNSVHVARPGAGADAAALGKIDPSTDHALHFAGSESVTIPPAADFVSDTVDMPVPAGADLIVSIHFTEPPSPQTGHPGSRQYTYIAHGDQVSAVQLQDAKRFEHWWSLSGVDVEQAKPSWSIVALGDSITDGHATTTNGNDRWTDDLARRLASSPAMRDVGVLNQGIGGNHLLTDGLGPNALARFDRDVLAQTAARVVIVLEGVNDLGLVARIPNVTQERRDAQVAGIIGAFEQIIVRAHAQGLKVVGCTITPFAGSDYYHPDAADEAAWQKVNAWIRQPGHFDAVVDLAKAVEDPEHPDRMLPKYDSGDHLHPGPVGYKAMGDAFDLKMLARLGNDR
jgi:lysophospholipase L1-like esterase